MILETRRLKALLLAGAALFAAPAAFAQTAPATPAPSSSEATQPDETPIDEVVVLGRNIPEPIRDTAEVANFLTVEDLKRTGDDNAAQALTRVTGLSLVSGRFVYVRGLGERYSQALLNGSPLPSPEPTQRVVPLDLFPASILNGTAVQKTFSASFPGEFGGGVIDLQTVGVPRDPYFNVSVGGGYDTEATGRRHVTYYGTDSDKFGFDDGTRKFPLGLKSLAAGRPAVFTGNSGGLTRDELKSIARSFSNAPLNVIQRDRTPLNGSVDVSGGRRFDTDYGRIGVVGVLGYRNGWQYRNGVRQISRPDVGGLTLVNDTTFVSNQNDIGWNALAGLAWQFGDHEIRYNALWVRSTSKRARVTDNTPRSQRGLFTTYNTEWFRRELQLNQLVGKSRFGDLKVDWRGTYGRTTREAPYERLYRYSPNAAGQPVALLTGANQLVSFSDLDENIGTFNVDFSYDLPVSFVRQAELKFGYAWQQNDRTSVRRDFTYNPGRNWDPVRYGPERIDYLVSDRNINDDIVELRELTGAALTGYAPRYDAGLKVNAGYLQIDSEIRPLLRASVGVRYEDAEETIKTFDIFSTSGTPLFSRTLANDYVLPAATLTWNFAEDQQVRLGVSKTIGRPQFRELAPQPYLDTETDRVLRGNSYLVDTEITNADLRYEYYFARNQFVTVGGFYKQLDKPVEALADFGEDRIQQTFFNAPKADLYGVELDFRKYFEPEFGNEWVDSKRWFVAANYTYTKSKLKVGSGDTIVLEGSGGARNVQPASGYVKDGDALQGQSDHLANLQFGFEDEQSGTQATLLATYTSERVSARGSGDNPDLIQNPGVRIDFVVRQDFTVRGRPFTLAVEARNLNGENSEEYQQAGGKRFDTNTFDLGTSVSVNLTAKF